MLRILLNWLTGGGIKALGDVYIRYKDSSDARERLKAELAKKQLDAEMEHRANKRAVVTTGMGHPAFWIPWLIATVPLSLWFGWGMLDTTLNGALPDVAKIPDGVLRDYADAVWSNLFYSGSIVAGAGMIASAVARRR